jgi:hypothetical protein
MWHAKRDAGAMYLFGSVHFFRGQPEYPPALDRAISEAEALVVEIELGDPENTLAFIERARLVRGTLRDVIPAPTAERLAAWFRARGESLDSMALFEPWFVMNLMVTMQLMESGFSTELGTDNQMIERARSRMDIIALESVDEQIDVFDGMPLDLQVQMLQDALDKSDEFDAATQAMVDAWQSGNARQLEDLIRAPVDEAPEFAPFYRALFDDRDEVMVRRLVEMSSDGRTRLVVLGAGHMVGDRGIPARLCDAGFAVRRLSGG